jgi:hypothetical protein
MVKAFGPLPNVSAWTVGRHTPSAKAQSAVVFMAGFFMDVSTWTISAACLMMGSFCFPSEGSFP